MTPWYKDLLSINRPVPDAALEICRIWRKYLDAPAVRLWLYNKDFEEFDLLACSCKDEFNQAFQNQTNQLALDSIEGKAFIEKKVTRIPSVVGNSEFPRDSAGTDFFKKIPGLLIVPLLSLEEAEGSSERGAQLGVLDVHVEQLKLSHLSDEDLFFLGSLSANTLSRGHALERKQVFAKLTEIALDLVIPESDKTFAERKKTYFSNLIQIILKAVHANCASIFTAEPSFDTIRCCASTGIERENNLQKVVYRKGDGATWTVFEKNEPRNSKNIQNDPSVPEYRGKFKEIRAIRPSTDSDPFLAVPMKGQQQGKIATGVIRVLERRCHVKNNRLQNFSQYDVDMLMSIAAHVSPVFRLLSLHEQRQRYVACMAHQVIQPITGIIAYSSNLLDGIYKEPKEILQKLHYIRAMARAATRLTQGAEWVAIAKDFKFLVDQPRSGRVLAQYILERINDMQPIREEEGIQFSRLDRGALDRFGLFWCDDLYFDQVVQNVLHNAIKYSYPGTIINLLISKDGQNLIIDVSSTGIPIETDERKRIFADCERGKWAIYMDPNGTGQGLCICRQIMNGFGGSVELIDSRPAKHIHTPKDSLPTASTSTFRIVLPKAFK